MVKQYDKNKFFGYLLTISDIVNVWGKWGIVVLLFVPQK